MMKKLIEGKELKSVILNTLLRFDEFCKERDIKYTIAYGTALGAIRHKGFIPWDDDLDFGFTRDNYEKFIATAKKNLSSEFFLQTWDSDREYGYAFPKIRKKGTISQERIAQDSDANCGIFIDLFPYDNLPNDKNKRRKLITKLTFLKKLIINRGWKMKQLIVRDG